MGTHEQRLTELEMRVAFLDSTVHSLDAIVAAQDRLLIEMKREFERLRGDLGGLKSALSEDARDEPPPPHY